jgi:hypothetical protein
MRRTGILAIPLALFLSAFGCGNASLSSSANTASAPTDQSTVRSEAPNGAPAIADKKMAANTAAARPSSQRQSLGQTIAEKITLKQSEDSTLDTAPTDRKIIRNADLTLESDSPEDSQREITSIAERAGGFVVDSQATSSDIKSTRRDIVNISIRVPSQKFADAMDEIRRTGTRIVIESVKGEDVTEEFIDVEARLRAKKALEMQFMEIMKRANSVNEALNVQSEIADVRGEIERIEGRKRFLENQSSLSTIKVRLQTSTATTLAASSTGFVPRLAQAFNTGYDFALNFILGLMTIVIAVLPFAALIGLPVFLGMRYLWKRRDRPQSMADIARDEISIT